MQTQSQKLNRHTKTILIGLYIGVQTFALDWIITWFLGYIWFLLPSNRFIISSSTTTLAVIVAYWTEETIRTSRYNKRTKVIVACLVLTVLVAAAAGLWLYWEYKLARSLQ
jgi:uncharacterized membrane protein